MLYDASSCPCSEAWRIADYIIRLLSVLHEAGVGALAFNPETNELTVDMKMLSTSVLRAMQEYVDKCLVSTKEEV